MAIFLRLARLSWNLLCRQEAIMSYSVSVIIIPQAGPAVTQRSAKSDHSFDYIILAMVPAFCLLIDCYFCCFWCSLFESINQSSSLSSSLSPPFTISIFSMLLFSMLLSMCLIMNTILSSCITKCCCCCYYYSPFSFLWHDVVHIFYQIAFSSPMWIRHVAAFLLSSSFICCPLSSSFTVVQKSLIWCLVSFSLLPALPVSTM